MRNTAECPGVQIVSRDSWGARRPRSISSLNSSPVDKVFIHHTHKPPACDDISTCVQRVKATQNGHMAQKDGKLNLSLVYIHPSICPCILLTIQKCIISNNITRVIHLYSNTSIILIIIERTIHSSILFSVRLFNLTRTFNPFIQTKQLEMINIITLSKFG